MDCARELIGCIFEWEGCAGRIVETEAYAAKGDPACHTFFRPSARKFVEAHEAGDAYVYLNYGVHWLFNVLVKGCEMDGFVLFRALEPVSGVDRMQGRRPGCASGQLCSGPGKLTKALGIHGGHHRAKFLREADKGLYHGPVGEISQGPRIGISTGRESLWRFGLRNSHALSRKF